MKVNDENSMIRDPNPVPLVRGMDPRIRIRIHTKMSWIRNIALDISVFCITAARVLYISLSSEKSIETHRRWSYSEIGVVHSTSSENQC